MSADALATLERLRAEYEAAEKAFDKAITVANGRARNHALAEYNVALVNAAPALLEVAKAARDAEKSPNGWTENRLHAALRALDKVSL